MKGIYAGAILTAPQLWKNAKVYAMAPEINGGYRQTTPYRDLRIIPKDNVSRVKSQGGVYVREKKKTIWVSTQLETGLFLLFQNVVYRILTDTEWTNQAGFIVYDIEKVIGDNGMPTYQPAANLGAREM